MDREFHRLLRGLLWLGCVSCAVLMARGQEAEPGDAQPPEAEEPAAAPEKTERSPLVGEPKSPEELLESTLLMIDLARLDLAKFYLDKLTAEPLDDDTLLALHDKFGAAEFLRLAGVPELQPRGRNLLDRMNVVLARHAADPERLARLLDELRGDPEQQAAALAELGAFGPAVVPGLIAALYDPARRAQHAGAAQAIMEIGPRAIPQLIGALDAPESAFRGEIMGLLGRLHASEAVPYLWYPAVSSDEPAGVRTAAREALMRILNVRPGDIDRMAADRTVARMIQTVEEHFRGAAPWKTDSAGKTVLWTWDEVRGTVFAQGLAPEEASDLVGLRFAREALALAPEERRTQVLYLALSLAAQIRSSGFDRPLPTGPGTAHDLALSVGSDVALDVLVESFRSRRPAVAVAALKVLGQIATLAQLKLNAPRPSPVVLALDYPDPRVQLAAASAILQADPKTPFRGAPRVVEVLRRSLAGDGRPHAVVGEVSAERGAQIGGFLSDLGYEALVFTSGRGAFRAAAERPDVDLIVLHPNIIQWPLSETLANLRADARTAHIPIVIYGPGELARKMERHVRTFQLIAFTRASTNSEDFDMQVAPFLRQIKTPPLSPAEQGANRAAAAEWLAHIAQGRRTRIFDISGAEPELTETLDDPRLAPFALEALAEIGSRTSQERIARLALDRQADLDLRRTAALKLAFHIQRFGLLLSQAALDGLHTLWQDEHAAPELRTAVGSVIGSLKPDATLAGERLKTRAVRSR
jgi:hypothetical protein